VLVVSTYVDAKNGAIIAYSERAGASAGSIRAIGTASSVAFIGLDIGLGYKAEGVYGALKGAASGYTSYQVGVYVEALVGAAVGGGVPGARAVSTLVESALV
jgi:hypothetical protein